MTALLGFADGRRWKAAVYLNLLMRFKGNIHHEQPGRQRYMRRASFDRLSDSSFFYNYATIATDARGNASPIVGARLGGLSSRTASKAGVFNDEVPSLSPSSFSCQKCLLKLAKEPVVTSCGHVFCWPCLYQSVSRGIGLLRGECPTCQSAVDFFRPIRTVTPINLKNDSGIRRRPSWVPPQPTGKAKYTLHNFPFRTFSDVDEIRNLAGCQQIRDCLIHAKDYMNARSRRLELYWVTLTTWVNAVKQNWCESYPSYEYQESPKIPETASKHLFAAKDVQNRDVTTVSAQMAPLPFPSRFASTLSSSHGSRMPIQENNSMTNEEQGRLAFLLYITSVRDRLQPLVQESMDKLYSLMKKHAIFAIKSDREVKLAVARLFKSLEQIHSLPFPFGEIQASIDDHTLTEILGQGTSTFPAEEAADLSVLHTIIRSTLGKRTIIPQEPKLGSTFGFHTLESQGKNNQIQVSTFETVIRHSNILRRQLDGVISFVEYCMDDLAVKMERNNDHILSHFKEANDHMLWILLQLWDGWSWSRRNERQKNMLQTEESNRWLQDYHEDWIEIVGRDFTDRLGPMYHDFYYDAHGLPDPFVTTKDLSSMAVEDTTFYCNVCGKVNDKIKEPVVTFCGHLFCWHCLYEKAIKRRIDSNCFHGFCPVCGQILDSGLHETCTTTIVSVCGKDCADNFFTSGEAPCRPVPKRLPIPIMDESMKILCTTAKEIAQLWYKMHLESQESKRVLDAIIKEFKPVLDHFKKEVSENKKQATFRVTYE